MVNWLLIKIKIKCNEKKPLGVNWFQLLFVWHIRLKIGIKNCLKKYTDWYIMYIFVL